jgi:hypothetical protein
MSALPPKADIAERECHVRFVPKADMVRCSKNAPIRSRRRPEPEKRVAPRYQALWQSLD